MCPLKKSLIKIAKKTLPTSITHIHELFAGSEYKLHHREKALTNHPELGVGRGGKCCFSYIHSAMGDRIQTLFGKDKTLMQESRISRATPRAFLSLSIFKLKQCHGVFRCQIRVVILKGGCFLQLTIRLAAAAIPAKGQNSRQHYQQHEQPTNIKIDRPRPKSLS